MPIPYEYVKACICEIKSSSYYLFLVSLRGPLVLSFCIYFHLMFIQYFSKDGQKILKNDNKNIYTVLKYTNVQEIIAIAIKKNDNKL